MRLKSKVETETLCTEERTTGTWVEFVIVRNHKLLVFIRINSVC